MEVQVDMTELTIGHYNSRWGRSSGTVLAAGGDNCTALTTASPIYRGEVGRVSSVNETQVRVKLQHSIICYTLTAI